VQEIAEVPLPEEVPGAVAISARLRLPHDVIQELLSTLAGLPPMVLCDLAGIAPAGAAVTEGFAPVTHYLRHWPGTLVLAHCPDPDLRLRLTDAGVGEQILICDSWIQGLREAMARRLVVQQERVHLAPVPSAAQEARRLVQRTLQAWELTPVVHPGLLVVSELVTNAVLHAHTVLELAVSYTDDRLRVAVGDRGGGVARPDVSDLQDMALTGRGLLLVHAFARGWGVLPRRPNSGKTVWAVIDAPRPPRDVRKLEDRTVSGLPRRHWPGRRVGSPSG